MCTEFYDITQPEASLSEVSFYYDHLAPLNGPILEAMCGSGRLMLPLLKRGIPIEGVDWSDAMLERCKARAEQQKLQPRLYKQDIAQLELDTIYRAIIIAYGSFQLITDKQRVAQTLHSLKKHLVVGGYLFLDTFIPWDFLKSNQKTYHGVRNVMCADGAHINLRSQGVIDLDKQLYYEHNYYVKTKAGQVLGTEQEEMAITWYFPDQLITLLEQCGFCSIEYYEHSFSPNDLSVIYRAYLKQ